MYTSFAMVSCTHHPFVGSVAAKRMQLKESITWTIMSGERGCLFDTQVHVIEMTGQRRTIWCLRLSKLSFWRCNNSLQSDAVGISLELLTRSDVPKYLFISTSLNPPICPRARTPPPSHTYSHSGVRLHMNAHTPLCHPTEIQGSVGNMQPHGAHASTSREACLTTFRSGQGGFWAWCIYS
jgi:hypothetical protein